MGIGQQIINGTYGLDNRPPTAEVEHKEKGAHEIVAEPAPTSITGLMIRKMIEEYERKMR